MDKTLKSRIKDIKDEGINKLDELFDEASRTEKSLPSVRLKHKLTYWPDYKTDWMAYGYGKMKSRLPKPTPQQLDRYDIAWQILLYYCDEFDRKLIWSVNLTGAYRDRGPNWTKVAKQMHIDPRTVKRRYLDALYNLWYIKLPTAQNMLPMHQKKAIN